MNPDSNGHAEDVPIVPIGLVPTILSVTQVSGADGRPLVLLGVSTPIGQACYLLDGDCAITTGQNLRQAGKASKAGLILPGP